MRALLLVLAFAGCATQSPKLEPEHLTMDPETGRLIRDDLNALEDLIHDADMRHDLRPNLKLTMYDYIREIRAKTR